MLSLLVANLIFTSAMFGVIWLVQILHYPMFEAIDVGDFEKWHAFHSRQISILVGPLMVGELILTSLLALRIAEPLSESALALTIAIWLATFLVSVPIHEGLGASRSTELLEKLVTTNWWRTIFYSIKLFILAILFFVNFGLS